MPSKPKRKHKLYGPLNGSIPVVDAESPRSRRCNIRIPTDIYEWLLAKVDLEKGFFLSDALNTQLREKMERDISSGALGMANLAGPTPEKFLDPRRLKQMTKQEKVQSGLA